LLNFSQRLLSNHELSIPIRDIAFTTLQDFDLADSRAFVTSAAAETSLCLLAVFVCDLWGFHIDL
jgi:hypothetical protein